jgi:5-methylcytosine-specific restriction endonuclease McrA
MIITEKGTQNPIELAGFPQILKLNSGGVPLGWITYEDSVYHMAKGNILWTMGEYEVLLLGGTNAETGLRSSMTIDTIIAISNNKNPYDFRRESPALTNPQLFSRDRRMCAYCTNVYAQSKLTRDHVLPRSKGGPDVWENVVTACRACNQKKDDKTPRQAGMELAYVPYVPSFNESLILSNRRILVDQMMFLMKGVSEHSRLHQGLDG